jgi:methionyl-tRNA formyltransferase
MKVLYFTNPDINDADVIPGIISAQGDEVIIYTKKISLDYIIENGIEYIVSDRSRSLIGLDVINHLSKKIINLHPSYLPFGRGYNPNYWTIVEGSPIGVTIHYIDAGIDTGDILLQTQVFYDQSDTLKTTYDRLRYFMVELFRASWEHLRVGNIPAKRQNIGEGSLHMKKEFEHIFPKLSHGWNTKITDLVLERKS